VFINIDKIAKLLGGEYRLFQAAMRVSVRRAFEKAFPQHAGLSIELNMDGMPSVELVFVRCD
jgi:hypothetical protein